MMRLLHLSKKITRWDFNIWKCCKKCKSFIMLKTRLNHRFYQYKELIIILLELNIEQYIR